MWIPTTELGTVAHDTNDQVIRRWWQLTTASSGIGVDKQAFGQIQVGGIEFDGEVNSQVLVVFLGEVHVE